MRTDSAACGRHLRRWLRPALLCAALLCLTAFKATAGVLVVRVEGAITPVLAEHVLAALQSAERDQVALVVLRIDTPGGLDTSMRTMIKGILASRVPVAAWVAPAGARAASAGTFLMYASHVAAMAPGTNVGAATPVAIGGGGNEDNKGDGKSAGDAGREKAVNDAAAYIRSLAGLRGRNADWAETAVRRAASLEAEAALKQNVIDLIAADLPALLRQLDGRTVRVAQREVRLSLADAAVSEFPQGWRVRVLSVLSDPSIALMLVMLGLAGLFLEFSNPGLLLPGALGAVSLLLGMYALQMLPLDFAGLALLLLGAALLVGEAFAPGGVLAAAGAIALVVAAVMLMDGELPAALPPSLVIALAALLAVAMAVVVTLAMRSRRAPPADPDGLAGASALVVDPTPGDAWVLVGGEHWRARSELPLVRGQTLRVIARDGLVLTVVPVDSSPIPKEEKQ